VGAFNPAGAVLLESRGRVHRRIWWSVALVPDLEARLARYSRSPRTLLAKALPPGATVVDVGCGDFHKAFNYIYQINPSLRIAGLDIGVEQTQRGVSPAPDWIMKTGYFQRVACDVNNEPLPFDDASVQGVFCSHLIEHVSRQEHVLSEMFRILAPAGIMYLETPGPRSLIVKPGSWLSRIATQNPPNHWDDPTHVSPPWNLEELSLRLRGAGFTVLRSGYHREAGLAAMPLYAGAMLVGMLPIWPAQTRAVLVGSGWWNLVGWPIWALARKP
jgi:SAM-dependent methyltransferase